MLRLGTECSGICAPSVALSLLNQDVDYRFACEYDKHCREQLAHHYSPRVIYPDMTRRNLAEMDIVDLYVLGSPCQSYSYLGNRKGAEDTRGLLIFRGIEYIQEKRPKYFIVENVKGFYTVSQGEVFREVMSELTSIGCYNVSVQTLNTKDYGVPQSRQRMYIVGTPSNEPFEFPEKVPCPNIESFFEDDVAVVSSYSPAASKSLDFYRAKIPTLDSHCHVVDLSATKNYIRRGKMGICPCLRVNSDRFYISTRRRFLTVRECLRLQGFPDSWESVCSNAQTRKQCGNAMSVNVLVAILKEITTC